MTTISPSSFFHLDGVPVEATVSSYLVASNNLSDLQSAATARTNLGLGTLATQSGTAANFMVKANNLSDLVDVVTARTNLGLGTLATQNGTVSDFALKSNNLSDLTSAPTARTNLGLGTLATQNGTFSGTSSGTNTGDETAAGILAKLITVDGLGSGLDADLLDGYNSTTLFAQMMQRVSLRF